MKVWKYGSYMEYVEAQIEANKRKLRNVWVRDSTICAIVAYMGFEVRNVLCHGTRNGAEQRMFQRHYPNAYVIGTEISDTAREFPHTLEHDFHHPVQHWMEMFDTIYSNSLDHAYDPALALKRWREQLHPAGRMFIEYSFTPENNTSNVSDPLEISWDEMLGLFEGAGLKFITTFMASGIKGEPRNASTVFVLERA